MLVPTRVFFPGVPRGEFETTRIMLEDVTLSNIEYTASSNPFDPNRQVNQRVGGRLGKVAELCGM